MTMTPVPVDSDFQRLVVEQALALAREVESTAEDAPDGQVLARCEGLLLTQGRAFLTAVLQRMAQHAAERAVKKGGSHGPASAAAACGTKGGRRARS